MDRRWSHEAQSFAESVGGAVRRLGGVEFTRRVEADPSLRRSELAPVLDGLGFPEIDVLADPVAAQAAAAAAQAAGATAMPWPIASQLAAPRDGGVPAVYLGHGATARLEHLDLFEWAVLADLGTGTPSQVTAAGPVTAMPLDPFGVNVQVSPLDGRPVGVELVSRAVDAHIVLTAYYVLGALESAVTMAAVYARERHQFERPIGDFGAIQWRLSDIVVARDGLTEIAGFTLWRFCERIATPADTLALRLAMVEAADVVLANSHQIFGAIGLCEEHDLTVIDRHVQAMLRRPAGVNGTSRLLRDAIIVDGFDGVFPVAPLPTQSAIGV